MTIEFKKSRFLRKTKTSRANNSKILRIRNETFSQHFFSMNTNTQIDFELYFRILLKQIQEKRHQLSNHKSLIIFHDGTFLLIVLKNLLFTTKSSDLLTFNSQIATGSFKNDVSEGEGGWGYKKRWQKATKGECGVKEVTQYSDVTHSVFYTDYLFYFFIFIDHNSSRLLYVLFHILFNIKNSLANDFALNICLLSFDILILKVMM